MQTGETRVGKMPLRDTIRVHEFDQARALLCELEATPSGLGCSSARATETTATVENRGSRGLGALR